MDAAVIHPSFSPWSAPAVMVTEKLPNKEEKVRMCIDYRRLNNVTKKEYNIIIGVVEAYRQIDMGKKHIPLTGFGTFQVHNEYLTMPFCSVNALSTLQRFMNITLAGLAGKLCMVYLDDIPFSALQEKRAILETCDRFSNDSGKQI
ncbi:hypothetical protein JTB14_030805 [Gonioctena quinquepunctata]|nr:hypothetical protein JTB14_030805 [Gonioctena quinquepunctata]